MSPRRCALLALLLPLFATPARAKEGRHRVRADQTAGDLAEHYYGARWKGAYIITRNNLEGDSLPVGKRIAIPASWTYTARRGDSYASIAKRMIGRADRYTAIVRFNRLSERRELEVGQELLMPFHLRHTVSKGESLSIISRRYYRTTKLGNFLKEYNALDSSTLAVGEKITVPIFDANTLDAAQKAPPATLGPDDETADEDEVEGEALADAAANEDPVANAAGNDGPEPAGEPSPSATQSPSESPTRAPGAALELATVADAVEAYRDGYFLVACPALEKLLGSKSLSGRERTRVIQHLGFCSVAFDDLQAAREYFRSWRHADPEATLDRRRTSPKILEIFDEVVSEDRR